jgi:hypothetical protein
MLQQIVSSVRDAALTAGPCGIDEGGGEGAANQWRRSGVRHAASSNQRWFFATGRNEPVEARTPAGAD